MYDQWTMEIHMFIRPHGHQLMFYKGDLPAQSMGHLASRDPTNKM